MIRLSRLQKRILSVLAEEPLRTQEEIADATDSHQSTISRSIRTLMDAELVTRGAAGYEVTQEGLKWLPEERTAESETIRPPSSTTLPEESIQGPLAGFEKHVAFRLVEEQLAALQKPAADILRAYARMQPFFEELETTGSLVTSLAHWQTDLADQLRLAAIPSTAIRLAESTQVSQELARALKPLTASQTRIAEHLAQIVTQADWLSKTWAMEIVLPPAKALETLTQLAVLESRLQADAFESLVDTASLSVAQYQDFVSGILDNVGDLSSRQVLVPLGEMKVSGRILGEAIAPLKDVPDNLDPEYSLVSITPNFYETFGREAATVPWYPLALTEAEVEVELENLLSVRIADAALALVQTRVRCNKRAQLIGQDPPFKPTVDTELISTLLPQTVVTDERGFRDFIDWLYKYIYESTGDLKRLLKYLPEGECQTAFDVKFLRRYYRHDLEHGTSREAQKKYEAVGKIFRTIIGEPYPENREHWQSVQLRLLKDLTAMIERLLVQLSLRGSPPT